MALVSQIQEKCGRDTTGSRRGDALAILSSFFRSSVSEKLFAKSFDVLNTYFCDLLIRVDSREFPKRD